MTLEFFNTYKELSEKARDMVVNEIQKKQEMLLCAATGASPAGLYELLAERYKENKTLFEQIRIIKLDEWDGISMTHPASCEFYLRKNLLKPLNIPASRYISWNSNPADALGECDRIQQSLLQNGPIDLCILGMGVNGHLGLNEPGDMLLPHCHYTRLSVQSMAHAMIDNLTEKPTHGFTLGMADILMSRKIILIVHGEQKRRVMRKFMEEKISTYLPASFLRLHPDVTCLAGQEVRE